MGETIIVFTLLSEVKTIKEDIKLPSLYDNKGNEITIRENSQKAQLCLLEDTVDFKLPDAMYFEKNIHYIQHAGSKDCTKKEQDKELSKLANTGITISKHDIDFSHIPGDPVWDSIAVICSDKTSGDKGVSFTALTERVKQSHFCRTLDDFVALVWLHEMCELKDQKAEIYARIRKISFAGRNDLYKVAGNFKEMREKAEKMWLEYQSRGTVS